MLLNLDALARHQSVHVSVGLTFDGDRVERNLQQSFVPPDARMDDRIDFSSVSLVSVSDTLGRSLHVGLDGNGSSSFRLRRCASDSRVAGPWRQRRLA
jgi:hypothetical protein